MLTKKTIKDIDVKDKTVIVRCDFNVGLTKNGEIDDDYRIRQALPTIEHLRSLGAKIVIISHMGRPEGVKDMALSLMPIATHLSKLLHLPVQFVPEAIGESAKKIVGKMKPKNIVMLENLRFDPREEANDESFAKELAEMGDLFVQDGFGVVYRKHVSTDAITRFLPSVTGLLLEREVNVINKATDDPYRPLTVIIGGQNTETKFKLLEQMVEKADFIAVVGAVANTFLIAEGLEVGKSCYEHSFIDWAKHIMHIASERSKKEQFTLYIPRDVVVATSKDTVVPTRIVDIDVHTWSDIVSYPKKPAEKLFKLNKDEMILDIGPMTAMAIAGALKLSKTAIWSGTAGVTEIKGLSGAAKPYAHGSKIIADALLGEKSGYKNRPFAIVGGTDAVKFVENDPLSRELIGHISTGGGASLELMVGNSLPGIDALNDKNS